VTVALEERPDGGADVVDGLVDAALDDLFFEGSEEAFGDAVGFGFGEEGKARCHAPEPDLVLEVIGHERAAVIVAERDTTSDPACDGAEDGLDRHADGRGSGVTITDLSNVPSHPFGRKDPSIPDNARSRQPSSRYKGTPNSRDRSPPIHHAAAAMKEGQEGTARLPRHCLNSARLDGSRQPDFV
jgi:hypothetical protein